MQNESVKSFDSIFIKHFYELYRNNDENKCLRLVLVNVLKHIFIEQYVPKVLMKYKRDKLILIPKNK